MLGFEGRCCKGHRVGGVSDKTASGTGVQRSWHRGGAKWSWGASKSEKSSLLG